MAPPASHKPDAKSYVSLALSVTACFLFLYNGFEDADHVQKDTRLVETSKIWHYNVTNGVASLDESVKAACVGLSPDVCYASMKQGSTTRLVIQGGLQMGNGGPVLRGYGTVSNTAPWYACFLLTSCTS